MTQRVDRTHGHDVVDAKERVGPGLLSVEEELERRIHRAIVGGEADGFFDVAAPDSLFHQPLDESANAILAGRRVRIAGDHRE